MKSLAVAERYGLARYVAHQAYYSLVGRDYEWELMPLGARPGRRRRGVEPARLGPAHRQDPPRPAAARDEPPAEPSARRHRPAGRRRVPLTASSTRSTRSPQETGKTRAADRAQLAAAAADRGDRHHRRAQRGAAAPEPRRRRLEPDAGAGRQARRRQRDDRWPIRTGTSAASRSATRRRSELCASSRGGRQCFTGGFLAELPTLESLRDVNRFTMRRLTPIVHRTGAQSV